MLIRKRFKGYISEASRVVSGVRAYRRFTLGQVETISKIKEFLDEGFTLLAAAQKGPARLFQPRGAIEMHNLTDKNCPLIGNICRLKGCTLFNERLDGCEISIMNYNLYQVKEHIRAWINNVSGVPVSRTAVNYEKPAGSRFPRPER